MKNVTCSICEKKFKGITVKGVEYPCPHKRWLYDGVIQVECHGSDREAVESMDTYSKKRWYERRGMRYE